MYEFGRERSLTSSGFVGVRYGAEMCKISVSLGNVSDNIIDWFTF